MKRFPFTSIDHMTHIDNLESIFKYGLLAHNNPYKKRDISNIEVNNRRQKYEPIYHRSIHEYVPFYFNPRNAMMYKNKDENVIILAFSTQILKEKNIIFTDKNAAANTTRFFNNIEAIQKLDWNTISSSSWVDKDPSVKQIMMAEVLVYKKVEMKYLMGIYCKNESQKQYLMKRYNIKSSKILIKPELFFQKRSIVW